MTDPGQKEGRLRSEMTEVMRAMAARGLNRGTSGNLSVRLGEDWLVTPSGVTPESAETVERVADASGDPRAASGRQRCGALPLAACDDPSLRP